jgi:sialate O-acetylesterase
VRLLPLTAGGPFTLTVTGKNVVTVKNVLVGEVWVCSGQSNMGYPLAMASTGPAAVAASDNPQLRLFHVPMDFSAVPVQDTKADWRIAGRTTTGGFSAVGYFFGRNLQKALGVPVGLIESDVGGTSGQLWTPHATMADEPFLKQTYLASYDSAFEQFTKATADWQVTSKAARDSGQPIPYKPDPPQQPASLYNGMIVPLTHTAIRGVIWYQGESNTDNPAAYRQLLPALIQSWRTAWSEPLMPFLIVQIAPWGNGSDPGVSWAELRQAQWETVLTTPRTGLAVITDVGDEKDLHPRDKETVGARLSLLALKIAYGQKIVAQGPTLRQATRRGSTILVRFDNVGSGLFASGRGSSGTRVSEGTLVGFTLAGLDGKPQAADAQIINRDTVEVSSPEVKEPQTVAYGFMNYPVVNLWNKNGLPAVPFRTAVKP